MPYFRDRPAPIDREKIQFLIDSKSIDKAYSESPEHVPRFLGYADLRPFKAIRTPHDTNCEALQRINSFENVYEDGKLSELKVTGKDDDERTVTSKTWFPYDERDVYLIGTRIFQKHELSEAEKEAIMLVHINMAWDWQNEGIFVTENKLILKSRRRISASGTMRRTIMSLDEAVEFMDLYSKKRHRFHLRPYVTANKGLWYWISLRSKLPHYNISMNDASMINALASRFKYLLMSVDEIGMNFYTGTGNDEREGTVYHFNYFITLITGIFDNLALESRARYSIRFDRDHFPSRTSLSASTGADFLKELKKHNPSLRDHIQRHADFINLIYEMRELVVHREGFKNMGLEYDSRAEKWDANVILISSKAAEIIGRLGDTRTQYSPFSKWGVYTVRNEAFVEPYRFAKTAGIILIKFVDDFLRLLGEQDWLATLQQKELKEIKDFEEGSLGFYADKIDK